MKREDLKTKIEELGLEAKSELLDYIMNENGVDINATKASQNLTIKKLEEQVRTLEAKNNELITDAGKYADYEELKDFKTKALEKEEENRKIDFLKNQGCKYPELFLEKIDFSKGKYNEDKKTYEGLDDILKNVKDGYKGMFETKQSMQSLTPTTSSNSAEDMSGVEKAFYRNNPDLMPKQN